MSDRKNSHVQRVNVSQLYKEYRMAKKEAQAADKLLGRAELRAKTAHKNLREVSEAVKRQFRVESLREIV